MMLSKNWRKKDWQLWIRDDRGTWLSDTFAQLNEPELYSRRLLELV
jgi:hypothetical protein